jgi:hypothetical protein
MTVTAGTAITLTLAATGFPAPSISESGRLPAGLSFADTGSTLSGWLYTSHAQITGTATGSGGVYPVTFTASNGLGTAATASTTITVATRPAFTAQNPPATFTVGTPVSYQFAASGYPAPAFAGSGSLPSGVTISQAGLLSGTPAPGTGGAYTFWVTASNAAGSVITPSFAVVNQQAAVITSGNAATFAPGRQNSFKFTATGYPAPALTESGKLPAGVTFTGTTATLTGTPGGASGGSYPITVTAANGVGAAATQKFTVTVPEGPAITSAHATTFTADQAGTFAVEAAGYPLPTFTASGALPAGVTLSADGTLSGTPAKGSGGSYPFAITASNGVGAAATQFFTLTVNEASSISSANTATFTASQPGTFQVVTDAGYPGPTFTESGTLPDGVAFYPTGQLAGTPDASSGGAYLITISASNGVGAAATQAFTLIVDGPPAITSGTSATFISGKAGKFQFTAGGYPSPAFAESGRLPGGVHLSQSGLLAGVPATGTGGVYKITVRASNSSGSAAKSFTLTVRQPPAFTSAAKVTVKRGHKVSFTVKTTGFPVPKLTWSGALPKGLKLAAGSKGTASLTGTVATTAKPGRHTIKVTAASPAGKVTQTLISTVS